MNKNVIYLIATILALVIIALVMNPKTPPMQATNPAASPTNGLVGTTTAESAAKTPAQPTAPASAIPATPTAPTAPTDTITPPAADTMPPVTPNAAATTDSDDVPASAEVSGEGTGTGTATSTPKPADDKGIVVPPSEGQ